VEASDDAVGFFEAVVWFKPTEYQVAACYCG
jgi:hypothetical protein